MNTVYLFFEKYKQTICFFYYSDIDIGKNTFFLY